MGFEQTSVLGITTREAVTINDPETTEPGVRLNVEVKFERWDSDRQKMVPYTGYFSVNCYGMLADSARGLAIGSLLLAVGTITIRPYKDKNGAARGGLELRARTLELMDGSGGMDMNAAAMGYGDDYGDFSG